MWTSLSVILACACIATAAPQGSPQPPVEIIASSSNVNADGSFNYSFEAGNGIKFSESGYLKPGLGLRSGAPGGEGEGENGDVQVVEGSFSYTAPDGTPISLSYTADDAGFHPVGDHLPTPPPIPEAIQRALSLLPTDSSDSSGAGSEPQASVVPAPAAASPTSQEPAPSK